MNRFSSAHGGLSPLNSVPCLASHLILKKLNRKTKSELNILKYLKHPKHVKIFVESAKKTMNNYHNIAKHIERESLEYDRMLIANINKLNRLSKENHNKYKEYNEKHKKYNTPNSKKDQKKSIKCKKNAEIYSKKEKAFSELANELKKERITFFNELKEKSKSYKNKKINKLDKIQENIETFDGKRTLQDIEQHTEEFIDNLNNKMEDISEKLNTHKKRNGFIDNLRKGVVGITRWIVKKCTFSSNSKENTIDLSKHDKHCNNTDSYSALEEVADSVVKMRNRLVNSYQYASNPSKFISDQRSAQFHNDLASVYQQATSAPLSL
ncbi:MAG: hypothetical protein GY821_09225 [Gammaproteobacteria bacterium]|nr:hypothetical protein [Gammaproteobacteria bacterium]